MENCANAYECFNYGYRLNLILEYQNILHAECIINNSVQHITHKFISKYTRSLCTVLSVNLEFRFNDCHRYSIKC